MRHSYKKKIRIYCEEKLSLKRLIKLDQKDTHYLKNVMRCKVEDTIILFNERDLEFFAKIKKF